MAASVSATSAARSTDPMPDDVSAEAMRFSMSALSVVRDFETGGGLIEERVRRVVDGCYAACLL